jgi:hypothetical protein
MTAPIISRRSAHLNRRDASTHLFEVGQAVRLRGSLGTFSKTVGIYRVTGTLPPYRDSPQYRIRNDGERHERVTTQDDLEPVSISQSGPSLSERTFGHGQGTETQQSRNKKAEAGKGYAQA